MKLLTYEMSKELVNSPKWKVKQVGDCLEWQGNIDTNGYGRFHADLGYGPAGYLAHRAAFIFANGYELPDMVVNHKVCSNRKCVNPDHLEACTIGENIMSEGSQSIQKLNSLKKYCPNGHALSGDNLMKSQLKRGQRQCRICSNARSREKAKLKRRELNELLSRRETDWQFTQKF